MQNIICLFILSSLISLTSLVNAMDANPTRAIKKAKTLRRSLRIMNRTAKSDRASGATSHATMSATAESAIDEKWQSKNAQLMDLAQICDKATIEERWQNRKAELMNLAQICVDEEMETFKDCPPYCGPSEEKKYREELLTLIEEALDREHARRKATNPEK